MAIIRNYTYKKAVRWFCYECMGYSQGAAAKCKAVRCALWGYRSGANLDDNFAWEYVGAGKDNLDPRGEWKKFELTDKEKAKLEKAKEVGRQIGFKSQQKA